jgi:hypothetical protein
MLVLLNFSADDLTLSMPELGAGKVILSTYLDKTGEIDLSNLQLRGDEGLLIQLQGEA